MKAATNGPVSHKITLPQPRQRSHDRRKSGTCRGCGLGLDATAGSAFAKLLSALPANARKDAEYGHHWYLVAARDDGEIRTYRVPKITSADLAEQTFERPRGFDLAAHWASACDRFFATRPVYPVRLRVQTPTIHRLSWAPGTTITEAAQRADGWSDVTMTFENAFEAATFLLGMAGDAVVVAPDELRDRIRTAADRLALLHAT